MPGEEEQQLEQAAQPISSQWKFFMAQTIFPDAGNFFH